MDKGLYNRLVTRGSMKRLVDEDAVLAAMTTPPTDTRAYFRGRCLERYPTQVAAASWDSVIFDLGRESLVRIPTLEPMRGTTPARRRADRRLAHGGGAGGGAHPRLSARCGPSGRA